MWYRFRQTIKISVVVCVLVWVLTLVCVLILHFWGDFMSQKIVIGIFFLPSSSEQGHINCWN